MFRKVSHIILAFMLLLTTVGLTISKHYCGDNLVSVSVFSEQESCCDGPGCCHNESFTVKVEDDFSATSFIYDFQELAIVLPVLMQLQNEELPVKELAVVSFETPSPPNLHTVLSRLQTYLL
jgi:hypothetical protein